MSKTPCKWGQHQWVEKPSAKRAGWIAAYCQVCKKFLGRRPDDGQPQEGAAPGGVFVWTRSK